MRGMEHLHCGTLWGKWTTTCIMEPCEESEQCVAWSTCIVESCEESEQCVAWSTCIMESFKSNCIQGATEGKNFQFLIPSFGLREHCLGYKQSFGTTGFQIFIIICVWVSTQIIMQMKLAHGPPSTLAVALIWLINTMQLIGLDKPSHLGYFLTRVQSRSVEYYLHSYLRRVSTHRIFLKRVLPTQNKMAFYTSGVILDNLFFPN